jgi:hypothetical protein
VAAGERSALPALGGLCLGLVLEDLLQDVVRSLRYRVGPPGERDSRGKDQREHHSPGSHLRRPPGAPCGQDIRLTYDCLLTREVR